MAETKSKDIQARGFDKYRVCSPHLDKLLNSD